MRPEAVLPASTFYLLRLNSDSQSIPATPAISEAIRMAIFDALMSTGSSA